MIIQEARSHSDEMCRAFNARSLEALLKLFSPKVVGYGGSGQWGIDGYKSWCTAMWKSFSDIHLKHEVISVAEDSYTGRNFLSGTHDGVFLGKAPTGKHFEFYGLFVQRIRDGKITEVWIALDDLGLRVQLGLLPNLG